MSGKFRASTDTASSIPPIPPVNMVSSDLPQISISVDKLPSRGLSYPKGSVIQYRSYSFGEVKKISQSKLDTKASFEFVLLGIESEFDKLDLTLGDFFYLGLLRRISTLGSDKVVIPYRCGGCNKISEYTVEVTNIEFEDLEIPELPIIVEFSDRELEFNPLTVNKVFELLKLGKEKDELSLIAKQCNLTFEEAYNFIDKANPSDSKLINEVDRLLYHSVKDVEFECKEKLNDKTCNHKNIIELDGGQALMMPFREREESIRGKIHFGNSKSHKPS